MVEKISPELSSGFPEFKENGKLWKAGQAGGKRESKGGNQTSERESCEPAALGPRKGKDEGALSLPSKNRMFPNGQRASQSMFCGTQVLGRPGFLKSK